MGPFSQGCGRLFENRSTIQIMGQIFEFIPQCNIKAGKNLVAEFPIWITITVISSTRRHHLNLLFKEKTSYKAIENKESNKFAAESKQQFLISVRRK
jgi:hypothetical protein